MKNELVAILDSILFHPGSSAELITLTAVAILSLALVMRLTSEPFGLHLNWWSRVVPVVVVAVGLSLVLVALVRMHLLPKISGDIAGIAVQVVAVLVVILAVALPLQCAIQKGSYVEAMMCFAMSLFAAALITTAVRAGWRVVLSSGDAMNKTKDRTELIDSELEAQQ